MTQSRHRQHLDLYWPARFRWWRWRPMAILLRRLGMSGGTRSARKNRPPARMNLVRTHNVPTMRLPKNANTEPKDTTYNKRFIAMASLPPLRLGVDRKSVV